MLKLDYIQSSRSHYELDRFDIRSLEVCLFDLGTDNKFLLLDLSIIILKSTQNFSQCEIVQAAAEDLGELLGRALETKMLVMRAVKILEDLS